VDVLTALPGGAWLIVAVAAVFAAAFLLFATANEIILERRHLNRTLRTVRAIELPDAASIRRRELALPVHRRIVAPAMLRLARFVRRFTPVGTVERIEQELRQLGSPPGWDAGRILALKVILPSVLVGGVVAMAALGDTTVVRTVVFAVVLALGGWFIPEWMLRSRAAVRQKEIQRSLADGLDLLSITVEAGLGFDSALKRVATEITGPLGHEFHRVVQEIKLGEPRMEALRSLADRSSVPELKSFVLAMIQADVLGISISQVLEIQASEIRLKRRQRAEEQAMKLPVKIIFPVILCIFPSIFIILLGPAAIQIYQNLFTLVD
jgi:tight adherence protein C